MILHGLDALTEFFAKINNFGFAKFLQCFHQDINQAHLNIHASKFNVLILL